MQVKDCTMIVMKTEYDTTSMLIQCFTVNKWCLTSQSTFFNHVGTIICLCGLKDFTSTKQVKMFRAILGCEKIGHLHNSPDPLKSPLLSIPLLVWILEDFL